MKKYHSLKKVAMKVEKEIIEVLEKISEKDTKKFMTLLLKSNVIFLTGQGRSGLVAEAFAMRLVHLGLNAHVVGEATAPSIKRKDILVAISGTGKTKLTVNIVAEAKKAKAKVIAITAEKKSPIAKKAKLVIVVKAKTKANRKKSIEPLGSLFEQAAFLYLDAVVIIMMKLLGKSEKSMKKRHAKLE